MCVYVYIYNPKRGHRKRPGQSSELEQSLKQHLKVLNNREQESIGNVHQLIVRFVFSRFQSQLGEAQYIKQ